MYRNVGFMSVWVCFWQENENFEPHSPTFLLTVLAARLFGSGGEEGDGGGIFSASHPNKPKGKKPSPGPYSESSTVKHDNESDILQLQVLCKEERLKKEEIFLLGSDYW